MLKSKLVKAGLFGFGIVPIIASVNGADQQFAETTTTTVTVDPVIRELQDLDSSFIELNALPSGSLNDVRNIGLNAHGVRSVRDYSSGNGEERGVSRERGNG